MNNEDLIQKLRILLDNDEDVSSETLNVYLELAGYKILEKCYPFAHNASRYKVPDRYVRIQLELARNAYLQVGADNTKELTDNGVKRVFITDKELLDQVYPCAHVPTTEYVENAE